MTVSIAEWTNTFSRLARVPSIFKKGSNCLLPIETHITCDFPGGRGPEPLSPPQDLHLCKAVEVYYIPRPGDIYKLLMLIQCFEITGLFLLINEPQTRDFQQCGILTRVYSDEPVQSPFKPRSNKHCSVSSLSLIEYSRD